MSPEHTPRTTLSAHLDALPRKPEPKPVYLNITRSNVMHEKMEFVFWRGLGSPSDKFSGVRRGKIESFKQKAAEHLVQTDPGNGIFGVAAISEEFADKSVSVLSIVDSFLQISYSKDSGIPDAAIQEGDDLFNALGRFHGLERDAVDAALNYYSLHSDEFHAYRKVQEASGKLRAELASAEDDLLALLGEKHGVDSEAILPLRADIYAYSDALKAYPLMQQAKNTDEGDIPLLESIYR